MRTVATLRVFRPKDGPDPAAAPARAASGGRSPALEPRKTTLWSTWLDRFAKFSAGLAEEVERIRAKPRQADLAKARRLQDHFLSPWTELVDTFDAVAGTGLSDALRADHRSYLDLRTALVRALIRRCLAPSDGAVAQLDAAQLALQPFVDARRNHA